MNRAYAEVELGVGVRVVKGDQTGYGYTEDLSLDGARRAAARTAAAIADGPVARRRRARFHVARRPARSATRSTRRWEDVRPEQKLPLLDRPQRAGVRRRPAREEGERLPSRDEAGAILIADSQRPHRRGRQPMTLLYLSVLAEQDGRREQNGYNVAGRAGFDFYTPERLDRVVREAVARTTILFEAVPPPAGEMPVVLAAGSSGILLHEAIGHGMEADFNRKNVSIYADKIGKPIAQPFVNIVDDAHATRARAAPSTWTTRATPPARRMLVRGRRAHHLPPRRDLARSTTA